MQPGLPSTRILSGIACEQTLQTRMEAFPSTIPTRLSFTLPDSRHFPAVVNLSIFLCDALDLTPRATMLSPRSRFARRAGA
jgi:hypothetical protein